MKSVTMLKNSSAYFVLCILFQMLVEINCQIIPSQRIDHTATFIDGKLYILGGFNYNDLKTATIIGKDFIYLDVSVEFNTQNLLWKNLSSINIVPPHIDATSVKGGANNNTLFLYGGRTRTESLVYTFDPQSNSWTIPKITGVNIIRKFELKGIIDNNGKMYLWGGEELESGNKVNDMVILDTINLSWGKGSSVGAPTPRILYGAVLLSSNRKIIYFGK
jgi:N-acetylneuraminic acid mutarotase